MPSRNRPLPATLVLLCIAAFFGGCPDSGGDGEILFGCDSYGRCSQHGYTCDLDRLCRPRSKQRLAAQVEFGHLKPPVASSSPVNSDSDPNQEGQGMSPEKRADQDCPKRCAKRQAECTALCEERAQCRLHCGRASDRCYARCHRVNDRRAAVKQRRDEKNCMSGNGQMRQCTEEEKLEMRTAMVQASKMFCRDRNGEHVLCPEQVEQLKKSSRFIPEDCQGAGCDGTGP